MLSFGPYRQQDKLTQVAVFPSLLPGFSYHQCYLRILLARSMVAHSLLNLKKLMDRVSWSARCRCRHHSIHRNTSLSLDCLICSFFWRCSDFLVNQPNSTGSNFHSCLSFSSFVSMISDKQIGSGLSSPKHYGRIAHSFGPQSQTFWLRDRKESVARYWHSLKSHWYQSLSLLRI